MIFPLAGLILGAAFGAFRANARGGNGKDIAQWSIVYAILFGLIGLFVLVGVERALI